jgi:hypothetical protein
MGSAGAQAPKAVDPTVSIERFVVEVRTGNIGKNRDDDIKYDLMKGSEFIADIPILDRGMPYRESDPPRVIPILKKTATNDESARFEAVTLGDCKSLALSIRKGGSNGWNGSVDLTAFGPDGAKYVMLSSAGFNLDRERQRVVIPFRCDLPVVPVAPLPNSAKIIGAQVISHTKDDDKDAILSVLYRIERKDNGELVAQLGPLGFGVIYKDWTNQYPAFETVFTKPVDWGDCKKLKLEVRTEMPRVNLPKKKWRAMFEVRLIVSEGGRVSRRVGLVGEDRLGDKRQPYYELLPTFPTPGNPLVMDLTCP